MNNLIFETNISNISSNNAITSKIRVDRSSIFIVIPDSNIKIIDCLSNINFLLGNCDGIICPTNITTIYGYKIDGKLLNLDIKKKVIETDNKKFKVIANIPTNIKQNLEIDPIYWFYDGSYLTKIFEQLTKKLTSKKAITEELCNYISKLYSRIKTKNPILKVELIFISNQESPLSFILNNLNGLIQNEELKEFNLFDNNIFYSNGNGILLPIAHKYNGYNKFLVNNINKINTYFINTEKQNVEVIDSEEGSPTLPQSSVKSLVTNLATTKIVTTFDDKKEEHVTTIDSKQLTLILKKYKITDKDVIANIQSSINVYIKEKGSKLDITEAELIILKAIHFTLHGTDEIREEYISNPELLFVKMLDIKTHKSPLNFPKYENSIIKPKDVINIDYTTGTNRQKFEFEKTIHTNINKLFKVLEERINMPIKIKKIDYDIIDNDMSRYINYTITLINQSGPNKDKQYTVELQVPSPVNDKYFKINGTTYIMANQQFFKPVTKTTPNEVRILTNYAINTIGIQNLKFDVSNLFKILDYIERIYSGLIIERNEKYCKFNDNSVIYFTGENIYQKDNKIIKMDKQTCNLIDQNGKIIDQKRTEYLYSLIIDKIAMINPMDKLTTSSKSIPFIYIRLGGIKIPIIMYMWQLKGLLPTLNDYGIDYEFQDVEIPGYVCVNTGTNYLVIKPKNKKEEYIVNGILFSHIEKPISDLTTPDPIFEHIEQKYGSGAINQIRNMTQNEIDPITKELLQFENLPVSLPNLINEHCVDMLLNEPVQNLADLKIYRSRMSELILNSMYKQITMAHNEYVRKVNFNEDTPKLNLDPTYIIKDIITDMGVLQHTEPTNPVEEIFQASRVIKTGEGGIPNKRSFKIDHRNIHESHYGIMSANTTPESTNVGLITSHTLTPSIINEYGAYSYKNIDNLKEWDTLSINEGLTPFQHEMDSDRLVMATTHAKQIIPHNGTETPYVATGGEFIVPQITSNRFIIKADQDGVVEEIVKNEYIKVKYKDGTSKFYHIGNRLSRTKMGQYLNIEMNTLEPGTIISKNQPIAFSKNFGSDGMYRSGTNMKIAVMNYMGFSFEDGWVITEDISNKLTRDVIKEVQIIIPPNTKILKLEKDLNKNVTKTDCLVEFTYDQNIEAYLDDTNLLDTPLDEEDILDLYSQGKNSIKLNAVDGEIVDCKIYINNPKYLDMNVITYHKKLVKQTRDLITKVSNGDKDNLSCVDNMLLSFMEIGGHKLKSEVFKGARIVYYIKQKVSHRVGDKLAGRYGNKGVVTKIIEKDNQCYTKSGMNIDIFLSPVGVFSRKNVALIKELYLGKIIYYLNIRAKELSENSKVTTNKLIEYILDVYEILGIKKVTDSVNATINSFKPEKFRSEIKNGKFNLFYTVIPFNDIEFTNIKTAADKLDIELDEHVYIPELDQWTKDKVPVGVSYILALEQFSEIYSNVRSTGAYQSLTGQATKG